MPSTYRPSQEQPQLGKEQPPHIEDHLPSLDRISYVKDKEHHKDYFTRMDEERLRMPPSGREEVATTQEQIHHFAQDQIHHFTQDQIHLSTQEQSVSFVSRPSPLLLLPDKVSPRQYMIAYRFGQAGLSFTIVGKIQQYLLSCRLFCIFSVFLMLLPLHGWPSRPSKMMVIVMVIDLVRVMVMLMVMVMACKIIVTTVMTHLQCQRCLRTMVTMMKPTNSTMTIEIFPSTGVYIIFAGAQPCGKVSSSMAR